MTERTIGNRIMANGWTVERRKKQSMIIHSWDPSSKSTGPKTTEGKAIASLNAFKHGRRTKYVEERLLLCEEILQKQIKILDAVKKRCIYK